MIDIILIVIFAIHAVVFLRKYLHNKRQYYYFVTSFGFVLLIVYYGYHALTEYLEFIMYSDWTHYLRFSGIALCVVSLPFLAKRLYFWFLSRFAHRS